MIFFWRRGVNVIDCIAIISIWSPRVFYYEEKFAKAIKKAWPFALLFFALPAKSIIVQTINFIISERESTQKEIQIRLHCPCGYFAISCIDINIFQKAPGRGVTVWGHEQLINSIFNSDKSKIRSPE